MTRGKLPTPDERRATLAKIDAAERAMLPGGVAEDIAAMTEARITRAQYEAAELATTTRKTQPIDLASVGVALILFFAAATLHFTK